jgi:hypothetical protein
MGERNIRLLAQCGRGNVNPWSILEFAALGHCGTPPSSEQAKPNRQCVILLWQEGD